MSLSTPKPTAKRRASALRVLERAERGGRDEAASSDEQPVLPPVEQLAEIFDEDDAQTIRRDLPRMQPRRVEVEVDDADATLKRPVRTAHGRSDTNAAFVGLAIPSVDEEHALAWDEEVEPTIRKSVDEMSGRDSEPVLLVRRSNRPPPSPALELARRNDRRRLLQAALLFALVFVAVTAVTAGIARIVMARSAPTTATP